MESDMHARTHAGRKANRQAGWLAGWQAGSHARSQATAWERGLYYLRSEEDRRLVGLGQREREGESRKKGRLDLVREGCARLNNQTATKFDP